MLTLMPLGINFFKFSYVVLWSEENFDFERNEINTMLNLNCCIHSMKAEYLYLLQGHELNNLCKRFETSIGTSLKLTKYTRGLKCRLCTAELEILPDLFNGVLDSHTPYPGNLKMCGTGERTRRCRR